MSRSVSHGVLVPFARRTHRLPLRVLLVEPDEARAAELAARLERDATREIDVTVEHSVEAIARLAPGVDAVVLGLRAECTPQDLARLVEDAGEVPLVTLGGGLDGLACVSQAGLGVQQCLPARCASCGEVPILLSTILWAVERAALQAQLEESRRRDHFLALHDELTGLPNLRLYRDRFGLLLAQARRTGKRFALVLIDLDRFKAVNDERGHLAGDVLLREVAGRLQNALRETDTVARRGGDEFAVLLDHVQSARDAALAARKLASALRAPYRIDGRPLGATASLGLALYPSDGEDVELLERRADEALYEVKQRGGDGLQHARGAQETPPR